MLIHDYLRIQTKARPDQTACIAGNSEFTYQSIDRQSNRFAHVLIGKGIQAGDRVAILLDNRIECVVALFGTLKAGAAFVLINPTTKPDKFAYILNDCAAAFAVVDARKREIVETARPMASIRGIIACHSGAQDPGPLPAALNWDTCLEEAAEEPVPRSVIDMDLAALVYTSGSTGKPKGVVLTHRNMTAAAESVTEYLELTPHDVILNVLPLSFDYGLYQLLMSVNVGGTLVLEKSFAYPYQVIRAIQKHKVTGFPGVPTVFALLLQMQDLDPSQLDTVRYLTNTGAALPPAYIPRLRALFRNARIFSMYGVTECKRVSYLPPEELDRRPDSVGIPIPNEQVYVADEQGRPAPPGHVGELVVRGANVMQGYWGLPEATARALRPGRYAWERVLYTGDLFRMDEEGYLYFVSRQDDIIKSRGEKVSPKEVENAIYELPSVQETAVIGVPDDILGQAVKAYVVPAAGCTLTDKEIISHCARRLENFMVPKFVEIVAELPKTDTGKIRPKHPGRMDDQTKTCARCILSERYPGVHLEANDVCNICNRHEPEPVQAAKRAALRRQFEQLADSVRPRPGYHVVVAFSGGKDSSYTLSLLTSHYRLRVLAVTFDNGFTSVGALRNIRRIVDALNVDSVIIKPRFDILKAVFARVVRENPFSHRAMERASALCNACIAFVKDAALRAALDNGAPMMAFGWSPGQAPLAASLFRMNVSMLRSMHAARSQPLIRLAGDAVRPYFVDVDALSPDIVLPYNVNPLAFHDYSEQDIVSTLGALGWEQPPETDGNSTNCLLNNLATRIHIKQRGFHPYGFEVAELIRSGSMTRAQGIGSLEDLGTEATAKWAAAKLGLDWQQLGLP